LFSRPQGDDNPATPHFLAMICPPRHHAYAFIPIVGAGIGAADAVKSMNDQYSDEEATRRTNEALRRALTSPPKPHKEMKINKRKAKVGEKASPKGQKNERS
jgi:hypothetical protein